MPRRPGRPRVNLEQLILADDSKHLREMEELVGQSINLNTPSIMAFEAACLLLAIERGADSKSIHIRPIFQKINQYAQKNGPHGKWRSARDFLEEFLNTHAPGWDWREDARQGEIEDLNYNRENERIAKEIAEDARYGVALVTKFHTPNEPDGMRLCALAWEYRRTQRGQRRIIRRTWPTLRELKLATAISERVLTKTVKNLRPKKTEMTKEPRIVPLVFDALRCKSRRHGAVPVRYGPRLVIGVLNEFLNRLAEFPIDDGERRRLRNTALMVKRGFAARLERSRRST
jgi:hypothetical protein